MFKFVVHECNKNRTPHLLFGGVVTSLRRKRTCAITLHVFQHVWGSVYVSSLGQCLSENNIWTREEYSMLLQLNYV